MDIKLHYKTKGEGFPLILLHGNGESHEYFENQTEYFSGEYRVIAIDTRGHGKSPRGEAPFTIAQFAEDLHDFMKQHGIEKAHILGFSDGGNIALEFALKYAEFVESLILNGANLHPSGVKLSVQMPIILGYRIALMFAKKSDRARKYAEMLGLMVNQPNIPPERLNKLHVRTLVIAGTNDMIKERHTQLIYESIPNSVLSLVEGDHFIANKKHVEFNRVVREFLQYIN